MSRTGLCQSHRLRQGQVFAPSNGTANFLERGAGAEERANEHGRLRRGKDTRTTSFKKPRRQRFPLRNNWHGGSVSPDCCSQPAPMTPMIEFLFLSFQSTCGVHQTTSNIVAPTATRCYRCVTSYPHINIHTLGCWFAIPLFARGRFLRCLTKTASIHGSLAQRISIRLMPGQRDAWISA